ncbi:thiamine pyrophosphokinase 1 [Halotydeus destructor]|nr:thiamine pyrophosphokinase 1 [Halotydeus destructor]
MANSKIEHQSWEPASVKEGGEKYAIILLNHSLDNKSDSAKSLFSHIWSKGCLRIGVDGGNNLLPTLNVLQPDIICGDFDSIKPEVKDDYCKLGSRIINTPDQNYTDFDKSIMLAMAERESNSTKFGFECIVAISSLAGRLDHVLSNINTLFKYADQVPIFLYDLEQSISWAIPYTKQHAIRVEHLKDSKWCSLVPVGQPAKVTTTGLKWNLYDDEMKFTGLISTSNELNGESEVTIRTTSTLLWTLHMP